MPPKRDPRKIGASDVVAITGMSSYASPYSVFLRITGKTGWDNRTNPSAEWGHGVENAILDYYEQNHGVKFVREFTYEHPKYSWMVATPDGVDRNFPVSVDAKNIADFDKAMIVGSVGLTDDFKVQGIWQIAIYNAWARKYNFNEVSEAVFYCVLNGRPPERFLVKWDDTAYEKIERVVTTFWRNAQNGIPPETSVYENVKQDLLDYFGTDSVKDKTMKPASDEAKRLVEILKYLKACQNEIVEATTYYEAKLMLEIGDAYGLDLGDGRKVIWPEARGRVSNKKLIEALAKEYKIPPSKIAELGEKFRGKASRRLDIRKA